MLVREIRDELKYSGVRQIKPILDAKLEGHGIQVGRDRLYELLSIHGMLQHKKKRRRRILTTDSKHNCRVYPNLLEDIQIIEPEQVFVCDITYIKLRLGYSYLSLVTDAFSRRIMGYCLYPTLESNGPISALMMALTSRSYPGKRLIHHSDRGIQYCCQEYVKILKTNRIGISMTRKRSPHENAIAERINGTLKNELGLNHHFSGFRQAEENTRIAIEKYNKIRPHSSCRYKTPDQVHFHTGH